jgi:hypothetical protein
VNISTMDEVSKCLRYSDGHEILPFPLVRYSQSVRKNDVQDGIM